MRATVEEKRIDEIRQFNRFFTRKIGILRDGLLHSPYSVTEARVLFELANTEGATASQLCQELGLDAGYLSRILNRFEQQGLLQKVRSQQDGRQYILQLTEQGKAEFAVLDLRSKEEIGDMLQSLGEEEQLQLLKSMKGIRELLEEKEFKYAEPFYLRSHEPGDMGWVTYRHGVLYAREYDWNEQFEALVAEIVSDFIKNYKPERERCWIAEMKGEIVGSIFLVEKSPAVAKLRLLLVEPTARGMGLGSRLVQECIDFARRKGYEKVTLWTNSILEDARKIYRKAGFEIVDSETIHNFGKELVSETWELKL